MLSANVQKFEIKHFNPENGLNGTYVYTTIQGPTGYKWIGTDYGLARFDGLRFELMDLNDSTKENFVTSVFSDQQTVCFGYFNGKIKTFNGIDFTIIYGDENQSVVVIEDLISTGGSSLRAVRALREEGVHVVGLLAIFTYNLDIANQRFTEESLPVETLSNYPALLEAAKQTKYIDSNDFELLTEWREAPAKWRPPES